MKWELDAELSTKVSGHAYQEGTENGNKLDDSLLKQEVTFGLRSLLNIHFRNLLRC